MMAVQQEQTAQYTVNAGTGGDEQVRLNPPKRRSHWRAIFQKYDLDNDGKISVQELRTMIQSESYENDIPEHTVQMIMQKADEDHNGYLDLQEFERMQWKRIFDRYDLNKDGVISLRELKILIQKDTEREIPKDIVYRLFSEADKNGDNTLCFDEFYYLVLSKNMFQHFKYAYIRFLLPSYEGQYEDACEFWPPPFVVITISIIQIIIFFWADASEVLLFDPKKKQQSWRFITYMFVHSGFWHLFGNLLCQFLIGIPLEIAHGWWPVLTIYVAGVFSGSLISCIIDEKLTGASGGAFALMSAQIASVLLNWPEMSYGFAQFFIWFVILLTSLGQDIANYRKRFELDDKISYTAHFAGALTGFVVGIMVLRNHYIKPWERVLWLVSIVGYCLVMTITIIFVVFL